MKPDCFTLPYSSSAIELSEYDPGSKCDFEGKKASRKQLKGDIKRLRKLHDIFAAQQQRALLIVLQGMDAAGKDGIVKHVMSGVNPQGVNVYSFRKPTEEEVRHDYLWRESKASDADLAGHAQWDAYVDAYQRMLGATSTPGAPWHIVPADRKWVTRAVVGQIIVDALEKMQLAYPEPSPQRREVYATLAAQLKAEAD